MKICSWNVNGVRSVVKKGFLDWLNESKFNIVCLQETKAQADQLETELLKFDLYPTVHYHSAERKGYSGVACYYQKDSTPTQIKTGFDYELLKKYSAEFLNSYKLDLKIHQSQGESEECYESLEQIIRAFGSEGRIIESHHTTSSGISFVLFNIYFPNGGASDERLGFKLVFYDVFLEYMKIFKTHINPNIIVTGDYNTAHHPIDLARPKENEETSGFMPIERKYLDRYEDELGFVDAFRYFYPNQTEKYTWWSFRTAARKRNIGWRIDYFYVSPSLAPQIKSCEILSEVEGSDHCPVIIEL